MYKTSLNQLIPTGDTSIGSGAGDPNYSKTPAGVKFQQGALSIDDEDFKDNLFVTYEAVAKSMLNTHFANMEGSDILKLSDEEKQKLYKIDPVQFAPFMAEPDPETGKAPDTTNQLEIIWDTVRSKFDFEIDPTSAITATDADQATNIQEALKTITMQVSYYMAQDGWKFNLGEAYHSLLTKMNLENIDQILTKMTDEEKAAAQKQPFPIVDPPQIRLTGQIPNGSMSAALAQGGVQVDPQAGSMQEQVDLGDIYKDPRTGPGVLAQIQQSAGFTPDVLPPASTGPTVDPVAEQQDKEHQQTIDLVKASQEQQKIDLSAQNQQHTQNMDIVREANAPDPMEMAKLKTKEAKPKAGVK